MLTNELKPTRPEYSRMPKPGAVCPYTSLSRSHLYQLATDGLIKTVSLRKRGTLRGVRLIVLDSVFAYIEKAAKEAEKAAKEAEGAA
jgi:hypothetical protein